MEELENDYLHFLLATCQFLDYLRRKIKLWPTEGCTLFEHTVCVHNVALLGVCRHVFDQHITHGGRQSRLSAK